MLAEVHDRARPVKVPAARALRSDAEISATRVMIDTVPRFDWYDVYAGGVLIGRLRQTEYTYSPRAAGHSGRVARFHRSVKTWHAEALDTSGRVVAKWKGKEVKPDPRMHTRQAALAFLLLAARSPDPLDVDPFEWVKR